VKRGWLLLERASVDWLAIVDHPDPTPRSNGFDDRFPMSVRGAGREDVLGAADAHAFEFGCEVDRISDHIMSAE